MMLVHWGNTNLKHNGSTTAYFGDNWNTISSDRRGNHTCFDPEKDLVLPAWKTPDANALSNKHWARSTYFLFIICGTLHSFILLVKKFKFLNNDCAGLVKRGRHFSISMEI